MVAVETNYEVEPLRLRYDNRLAGHRVADEEMGPRPEVHNEEAITGAFPTILRIMFRAQEKRSELLMANTAMKDYECGGPHVATDNAERWLAAVVLMQECGCGCHTAS